MYYFHQCIFQTSMTANLHPVKMVGHVWMESTNSAVDVKLDSLGHIVKQVSGQWHCEPLVAFAMCALTKPKMLSDIDLDVTIGY